MKRMIFIMIAFFAFTKNISAQEIFKEVKNLQAKSEAIANDTTKSMEARKVACFKYDAIYYLIDKATDEPMFTEYDLGQQTDAMIEFVNYFIARLQMEKKDKDKEIIKAKFKAATINNSLFNDMDKEVVYGYVDNDGFITQFSLDTDWVKALNEVKNQK